MTDPKTAALDLREAISHLRRTPMSLSGLIPLLTHALDAMSDQSREVTMLRAFANAILEDWPEGGGLDGGDLQDIAVKYGLLAPVEVTERCGEECGCAEYDDFPMQCFRKTELLKGDETL